jgi:tetratricopeptide (TPR) repeat protein
VPAWNNWGNALLELGRLDQAAAHYREAARIAPGRADLQYNWGVALERAGLKQEAMARFREALRLDPGYQAAGVRLRGLEGSPDGTSR